MARNDHSALIRRPIADPSRYAMAGGSAGDEIELLERLIDRIFNAGLLLQLAMEGASAAGAASIQGAITELDEALRDIRRGALTATERGGTATNS